MAARRIPVALLAALAAAAFPRASVAAKAPEAVWTVTCTEGGRVVAVERVLEPDVEARSFDLNREFPKATCVSLGEEVADPAALLQGVSRPTGDDPALSTGAPDLDTALHAIRGGRLGTVTPPSPSSMGAPSPAAQRKAGRVFRADPVAPAPAVEAATPPAAAPVEAPGPAPEVAQEPALPPVDPAVDPAALRPDRAEFVRVAVYRGADPADVIADWERVSVPEPRVLGPLVPAVTDVGGYSMLSVGPVPVGERVGFCLVARSSGLECVPGPDGREVPTMDGFLSGAGGAADEGVSPRPGPLAVEAMESCGQSPFATASGACPRSALAGSPLRGPDVTPSYAEARDAPAPPLPRSPLTVASDAPSALHEPPVQRAPPRRKAVARRKAAAVVSSRWDPR